MLSRLATLLGLVALVALAILRVSRPPDAVPATAPDTVFSAERALRHVEAIAQRPHPIGSADHDRVRDYIAAQLTQLGLRPQLQVTTAIGTRYQEAGRVQNILAYIPGSSPNGKAVLIMAHYDGVEAGPAASDDGAGCAALLEAIRAMRARKTPLAHDIIALFTDGEEAGLLGAAAFVREHPWAKDVAFALNFEARGTTGRSYMFETGPGNLDAVRQLRAARDVTAGSVFVTIYRALPNDTDLSELTKLGVPALNFAFADGVERYHTARDDIEHLNPGSLQHHGQQLLRVATRVANEDLPRPKTGDAVFFDFPVIGLVIYPEWFAWVLVVIALLIGVTLRPVWRDAWLGAAMMALAIAVSVLIARLVHLDGAARWSGMYAAALALLMVAINLAAYRLVRARRANAYHGVLLVWIVLSLFTTFKSPGVSYLFTWPALFALIAARSKSVVAAWVAAAVTIFTIAGLAYSASAVMLGVTSTGAIALGVLTALMVWLVAPLLDHALPNPRWDAAIAACAVVVALFAHATVHQNVDHPVRTAIVYAENPDAHAAWLGSMGTIDNDWTREVVGPDAKHAPSWTGAWNEYGGVLTGRRIPPAGLEPPRLTYIRDTIIDQARRVVFRLNAPRGSTVTTVRAAGAKVGRAAIDARVVDTTRFRYTTPIWEFEYWNVPDSGAVFSLAIPVGARVDIEASARTPGLPGGIVLPPRPPQIVPSQTGDASVVYVRARY